MVCMNVNRVDTLFSELDALWRTPKTAAHVRPKLLHAEQVRLDALSRQAKEGDAPLGAVPPSKLFSYRDRCIFDAWIQLRGRMTQQVAKETFCTEVLSVFEQDARFADIMLPDVQRAVNAADAAQRQQRTPKIGDIMPTAESLRKSSACVRIEGYREDPAFVALLWFARSTCGHHEITIRHLPRPSVHLTSSPSASSQAVVASTASSSKTTVEVLQNGLCVSELGAASSRSSSTAFSQSELSAKSVISSFLICARVFAPYASFWIEVGAKAAVRSRLRSAIASSPSANIAGIIDVSPLIVDVMSFIDHSLRVPLLRLAVASSEGSSAVVKQNLLAADVDASLTRITELIQENQVKWGGHAFLAGPHVTIADLLLVSCLFIFSVKSTDVSVSVTGAKRRTTSFSSSAFVNALPGRLLRGYALAVLAEIEGFPYLAVDARAAVTSKL